MRWLKEMIRILAPLSLAFALQALLFGAGVTLFVAVASSFLEALAQDSKRNAVACEWDGGR